MLSNNLDSNWWISKAWMEVKPETVSRCFRRAGILTEQLCDLCGSTSKDLIPLQMWKQKQILLKMWIGNNELWEAFIEVQYRSKVLGHLYQ